MEAKVQMMKDKKKVIGAAILLCLIVAGIIAMAANSGDRKLARQLELGQKYLDEMDYEQAVVAFTKAIEIDPNCVDAYMGRGDAYMGLGGEENMSLALADYQMVLTLDETCTEAYISIADIYIAQGRSDMAYDILEQGLKKAEDGQRIREKLDDMLSSENVDVEEDERGAEADKDAEELQEEVDEIERELAEIENPVYAHSGDELKELLENGASDCTIVLDGTDYRVDFLYMKDLENVTIFGVKGTRILSSSVTDVIMHIGGCKGLTLKNLVIGHDATSMAACTEGVLDIYGSEMTIVNCDIFGCGVTGFSAVQSSLVFEKTIIRDCSSGIFIAYDITADFKNCSFTGNGYSEPYYYAIDLWIYETGSTINFSDCIFENNHHPALVNEEEGNSVTFDNCTFTGNAWD